MSLQVSGVKEGPMKDHIEMLPISLQSLNSQK